MCVLPALMFMYAVPMEVEKGIRFPETGVMAVVSYHVGAEN